MTTKPKNRKTGKKASTKPIRKALAGHTAHKKRIRNINVPVPKPSAVQNNLGQMVKNLMSGKNSKMKVQACQYIAEKLSKLAGLRNGHVWHWNYIASIESGSMQPSKKFIDALKLYLQDFNPQKKQWFYFVSRHTVASVYNKCIMAEIIKTNMRAMGYKLATRSRYMEVKKQIRRMARETRKAFK